MLKKSRDGGQLKKLWFSLLDRELYCTPISFKIVQGYESKYETQHTEMFTLVGVFIKDEPEEVFDSRTTLYPLKIILPKRARTFYLASKVRQRPISSAQKEKKRWLSLLRSAAGYSNITDFYDI